MSAEVDAAFRREVIGFGTFLQHYLPSLTVTDHLKRIHLVYVVKLVQLIYSAYSVVLIGMSQFPTK